MNSTSFEVARQKLKNYLENLERRNIKRIQKKIHKNFSPATVEELFQKRPLFSLVGVKGRVGKTYIDKEGFKIIPVTSTDGKRKVLAKLDPEDEKHLMEKLGKLGKDAQINIYGQLIESGKSLMLSPSWAVEYLENFVILTNEVPSLNYFLKLVQRRKTIP